MMVDHPLYQYRHVGADGRQRIAETWNGRVHPVVPGESMAFGYWRPGTFNILATLTFERPGAEIMGLYTTRFIEPEVLAGDPDLAYRTFYEMAQADELADREARERSFVRRMTEESRYQSAMTVDGGIFHSNDELSIRKNLDRREPIVYGVWDKAGGIPAPIAKLEFHQGPMITFTAIGVERGMTFEPNTANDLDCVANSWMTFTQSVRDELGLETLFAYAKAEAEARATR